MLEGEQAKHVNLKASPMKGLILKGESEDIVVNLTSYNALKLDGSSKAQVSASPRVSVTFPSLAHIDPSLLFPAFKKLDGYPNAYEFIPV